MALNKLKCTVTGLWFGASKARREKLVAEFGSQDRLEATYVSRIAGRHLKDGKSIEDIQALVASGEITSNTAAPKRDVTAVTAADTVLDPNEKESVSVLNDEDLIEDNTKSETNEVNELDVVAEADNSRV